MEIIPFDSLWNVEFCHRFTFKSKVGGEVGQTRAKSSWIQQVTVHVPLDRTLHFYAND